MESLQGEFDYINGGMGWVGGDELLRLREPLRFGDVTQMSAAGELRQALFSVSVSEAEQTSDRSRVKLLQMSPSSKSVFGSDLFDLQ